MEVHEPNHKHPHDSSSKQPILRSNSNVLSSHLFGDSGDGGSIWILDITIWVPRIDHRLVQNSAVKQTSRSCNTLRVLGFNVWFCLFVAVCSTVATVLVCVCMLCMYCAHAMHLPCVWGKSTKGDRTIDRVRVNGLKRLVLIVRT